MTCATMKNDSVEAIENANPRIANETYCVAVWEDDNADSPKLNWYISKIQFTNSNL